MAEFAVTGVVFCELIIFMAGNDRHDQYRRNQKHDNRVGCFDEFDDNIDYLSEYFFHVRDPITAEAKGTMMPEHPVSSPSDGMQAGCII